VLPKEREGGRGERGEGDDEGEEGRRRRTRKKRRRRRKKKRRRKNKNKKLGTVFHACDAIYSQELETGGSKFEVRCHYTPTRTAKIQNIDNTKG
jgi:hypothetical protein